MGATDTVNRKEVVDAAEAIAHITGGGCNFIFDTSGVTGMVKTAFKALRGGGTLCTVGAPPACDTLAFGDWRGRNIISVNQGDSNARLFVPQMLEYYKMGRFPFDKLISYYDFKDINKAVEDSGAGKVIKAVCRF
jgi:aryl-alcohol dehydrogenase